MLPRYQSIRRRIILKHTYIAKLYPGNDKVLDNAGDDLEQLNVLMLSLVADENEVVVDVLLLIHISDSD